MNASAHPAPVIVYVIAGIAFVALFAVRMRRMMTATAYNPYRAWLFPAVFLALSGLALWGAKPQNGEWLWVAGAAAIGGVEGYFRGRSVAITLDPETGELLAQGSAWAMVFIVVLIAIRFGGRYLLSTDAAQLGLRPIMADVLSAITGAGIFVARGVEMGLRGHKLLEARKTTGATVAP